MLALGVLAGGVPFPFVVAAGEDMFLPSALPPVSSADFRLAKFALALELVEDGGVLALLVRWRKKSKANYADADGTAVTPQLYLKNVGSPMRTWGVGWFRF